MSLFGLHELLKCWTEPSYSFQIFKERILVLTVSESPKTSQKWTGSRAEEERRGFDFLKKYPPWGPEAMH